jgi:hypothetical protein
MNFVETPGKASIPLRPLHREALSPWLESQSETVKRWVTAVGFQGEPGKTCLVPGDGGIIREALVGISADADVIWDFASLPATADASALRIYPGLRHEIFQEPEQEGIFGEVLEWVRARESERGVVTDRSARDGAAADA